MSDEHSRANEGNSSSHEENAACPRLVVEGGIQVLYKGVWVREIPFDRDEIAVGVMDPENDIYPDINLRHYRLEGGDPYISRRHAAFTRSGGKYYVQDYCKNNSTSIDTKNNILNGDKAELQQGMRVFVSESVAFRFETGPAANAEGEKSEPAGKQATGQMGALYYLEVEGQIPLFFKPHNTFTHIIELNPDEWKADARDNLKSLQIGRRSSEDGVYPDIDLWKFYFNDGDEYIARRHARLYEKDGKFYFQDLSGKGSTWYNVRDDEHRLVRTDTDEATREIQLRDKLIISDSAVFIFRQQEALEEEEYGEEGEGKES